MLSKNAERVYWLGRYVERTEDTAKMLKAFTQVMLDIPRNSKISWDMLLKVMSAEKSFYRLYDSASELNVISFLLFDEKNPSSIYSSIRSARENARTSRDLIPMDGWEMLNDLNILLKESDQSDYLRQNRYKFLIKIIAITQQFNGMIQSSLSRNQAYDFLRMGAMVERADMSTRLLDVAAGILLRRSEEHSAYDTFIWLEILRAHNAMLMYRTVNGPVLSPKKVLDFILCNGEFPRSLNFSVQETRSYAELLPENEEVLEKWKELNDKIAIFNKEKEIEPEFLHRFFDDIQKRLNNMHNAIAVTWFPTPKATAQQSQQQSIAGQTADAE